MTVRTHGRRQQQFLRVIFIAFTLWMVSGCRPFQSATQYCTEAPCAVGLECVEGVCLPPLPQPEPEPPCLSSDECGVDGSTDGRDCVEGECVWVGCNFDQECGTRICDRGECLARDLCIGDEDCKDGAVCIDGSCRSPCLIDDECGQGLLPEVCLDGRCEQTCLVDFLCFGGICEEGLCQDAACAADADCPGENQACNGGRCEVFTPCDEDDDCFDPDFLCSEIGRCEARPTCVTDGDCGAAFLCLGSICRPADSCLTESECAAEQDCVGARCVTAPVCRSNVDCGGGAVCAAGSCFDPPAVLPASVVVETAHGECEADGSGACSLSLYQGELAFIEVGTFDTEQAPITPEFDVASSSAAVTLIRDGRRLALSAVSGGAATISIGAGANNVLHDALLINVIDTSSADELRVLVVDGDDGAPVAGASVTAGDAVMATGANGLATFATSPGPDARGVSAITVGVTGRSGVIVLGLGLSGNLRVVLPRVANTSGLAAGVSAQVISTGDEVGPVGYGVALLGQASIHDASLETLFGPDYGGSLVAPIIGSLPVALPAAVQMEAALPFSMASEPVRDVTYSLTSPGRRALTGFELRTEVGDLLGNVLGSTATDLALNLASDGEGMDALVVPVGRVPALPLVADEGDIDGDGDTVEQRPDFSSLPNVEVAPSRKPSERVGLIVSGPPTQARGRLFTVGGLDVAGMGFVPTGMGTIGGDTGASEQLRVVQPSAAMSDARRQLRVQAVFDNPERGSALLWSGTTFSDAIDLGAFLNPPEGSFVLEDVPLAGGRLLILAAAPGATTYAARILSAEGEHLVLVAATSAGGRSVSLPATITSGVAVLQTTALTRPGPSEEAATSSLVTAGSGPLGDVRDGANAIAWFIEPAGG